MPPIFLSNGSIAEVSKEDHIFLAGFYWCRNTGGYVQGLVDGTHELMHRAVAERMGLDLSADIDHIDRNKLNNRRENLRAATRSQNKAWSGYSKSKSGYRGVSQRGNKWMAQITAKQKTLCLGTFDTPEKAHAAYCEAAKKHFGEFANLD